MRPDQRPKHWADLSGASPLRPRLVHYPPGLRQPPHRHVEPHLSIVLAGALREESRLDDRIVGQGMLAFRADGMRHAVRFGPDGALVFSMDLPRSPAIACRSGARWLRWSGDAGIPHGDSGCPTSPCMKACAVSPCLAKQDAPPSWLEQAAQRLIAAPGSVSVARLAGEARVHRVHFSRLFKLHYGLAPSIFRRRAMAAHALAAALSDADSLAGAAAMAGFVDQSHMSRAVREGCGFTPGAIRSLISAQVASIQSPGLRPG